MFCKTLKFADNSTNYGDPCTAAYVHLDSK